MVLVEEVPDETLFAGEREEDFETDSNVSEYESDDEYLDDETLYDRLVALKDIVPPTTRVTLKDQYEKGKGWLAWGVGKAGTIAWVVSTSALLVGLPLALAIEDEARVTQQEREMQMQTQGQQQMLGAPAQGGAQGVLPPGF